MTVYLQYNPLPSVSKALERDIPGIILLDGDGQRLVPRALREIVDREPHARALVIIDGPKGAPAVELARAVCNASVAVVIDDQWLAPKQWPWPSMSSDAVAWRERLPIARDRDLLIGAGLEFEAKLYAKDSDVASVLLGGKALQ